MKLLVIVDARDRWMVRTLDAKVVITERAKRESIDAFDVVWVRSRRESLLRVLDRCTTRIVNAPEAIRNARHRKTSLRLAATAGVPVARDYEGTLSHLPFERAVLKRRHDDGRSLCREGMRTRSSRIVYAQRFIESAWEHKLYLVGEETFHFVQRPTMIDPSKSSRARVKTDATLDRHARKAARACGLTVAGVDFLLDRDSPRMTDINSNIGLHTFREGYAALLRHLRA